ncbi:hypothetical protein BaRGS_00017787 [Batillaria attramentaria]|uniref:Nitrate/nitrite sensing protein domain-containing protein n=1 Tax=Batillaria attramentaria TaxID=370345 RepID=A0ABD0KVW3_9CAEN
MLQRPGDGQQQLPAKGNVRATSSYKNRPSRPKINSKHTPWSPGRQGDVSRDSSHLDQPRMSQVSIIPDNRHPTFLARWLPYPGPHMRRTIPAHTKDETWTTSSEPLTRGEPLTDTGKRLQPLKILSLTLLPILGLWAFTVFSLSDSIQGKSDIEQTQYAVKFSVEIGMFLDRIQRERDMSVLYLSILGPETKTFLMNEYLLTDQALEQLSDWPVKNDIQPMFQSKKDFHQFLQEHRNNLDPTNYDIYVEMDFYSFLIERFIEWMYGAIRESNMASIWKILVAYQKIVTVMEHIGIERALGTVFFVEGGFPTQSIYERYKTGKVNIFKANYRSAVLYSKMVNPIFQEGVTASGTNLTAVIEGFRFETQHAMVTEASITKVEQSSTPDVHACDTALDWTLNNSLHPPYPPHSAWSLYKGVGNGGVGKLAALGSESDEHVAIGAGTRRPTLLSTLGRPRERGTVVSLCCLPPYVCQSWFAAITDVGGLHSPWSITPHTLRLDSTVFVSSTSTDTRVVVTLCRGRCRPGQAGAGREFVVGENCWLIRLATSVIRLATSVIRLATSVIRLATSVIRLATSVIRLATSVIRLATSVIRLATSVIRLATSVIRLATSVIRLATSVIRLATSVIRLATSVIRLATSVIRLATSVIRLATSVGTLLLV